MTTSDPLSKAINFAYSRLRKAGKKRELLPLPLQTAILVEGAQGIIDNGGLQYLFESNWEDLTPYQDFCDAYRRIGAKGAAARLERAVAMFKFANPHLHAEKRIAAMERLWADEKSGFADLDFHLCGDDQVWHQLEKYVKRHGKAFLNDPKRRAKPSKRKRANSGGR